MSLIRQNLISLGLSEKEAGVYLAALESGTETAQEISKRAGINRATTYVIVEKLMKRGLMSSVEKGKKTLFQAENPRRLHQLLKEQEEEIQKKEKEFKKYLPELETLFNISEEKPRVKFFEGKEGVISIREDYLRTKNKNVIGFLAMDEERSVFSEKERNDAFQERIKRKINFKIIYTNQAGKIKDGNIKMLAARYIPTKFFPLSANILIYDEKVGIFSLKGKLIGVIIQSEEIANTLRSVFNLAWESAGKYQK